MCTDNAEDRKNIPIRVPFFPPLVAMLAVLVGAAACGDDQGPQADPTVQILVTDAPSDYVASAEIWVSRVYLQRGSDMNDNDVDGDGIPDGEDNDVSARVDLFNDPENQRHFDLLLLRDGLTEALTSEFPVEPGTYAQLRLVVDSARVTLADGFTFEDQSTSDVLFVPSGAQSGIKVQLTEPIEADENDEIQVLLDFDVDENFVIQGNPESPAGIKGFLFTPTLQEMSRSVEEG